MSFGDRLKKVRGEMGITQAELADILSVTRATVNRWERGANPPRFARLVLADLKAAAKRAKKKGGHRG